MRNLLFLGMMFVMLWVLSPGDGIPDKAGGVDQEISVNHGSCDLQANADVAILKHGDCGVPPDTPIASYATLANASDFKNDASTASQFLREHIPIASITGLSYGRHIRRPVYVVLRT